MPVQIHITDNSNIFKNALQEQIDAALEAVGVEAESNAKIEITKAVYDQPASPNYVRTGRLRNSITHDVFENFAYVGTAVKYAAYVELGTSKMPPRPYIKPAVENHVDDYIKIVKTALKG